MRDERPFAMKKRVFKAYEGSLRNAEGDASNERGVVVTPTPGEEELMTTQSRVVIWWGLMMREGGDPRGMMW
jgi:hypothetical protein